MPILFDHDPVTGITEYFDYDPVNDTVSITASQDVTGFLDRMNTMRNTPDFSAKGIKEDRLHYASIPQVVELQLRNKGLHLENKDHMQAILREINTNFPYLKATDNWHR
jgi:hypothetical protein